MAWKHPCTHRHIYLYLAGLETPPINGFSPAVRGTAYKSGITPPLNTKKFDNGEAL